MSGSPKYAPRLLATLLMGFLLSVLATTLFAWWAVGPLRLQPMIVLIVSAGFRLPLMPGAVVVVILGILHDLQSGGLVGLHLTAFSVVFLICTLAERKLAINAFLLQMAAVGLMSLVEQLTVWGGLSLVRLNPVIPLNLSWLVGAQAVLSALTAPLFFGLLELLSSALTRLWPAENKA